MWINITDKDIVDGNKTLDACPITIALRRKFGNNLSISRDYIRIKNKKNAMILLPLPKAAKNFLLNNSRWYKVRPFKFQLTPTAVKKIKNNVLR